MHYLDNSATTLVIKEAAQEAFDIMVSHFGNPSSLHKMGIEAGEILSASRKMVATSLKANEKEIFFTSGGTESINTAIFGVCRKNARKGKHIITSEIEHSATLLSLKKLESEGFEVTYLKPNSEGSINIEDFENALREDTILVTLMLVNNETGAVLPLEQVGKILKKKSSEAFFHIDAVQAFFRMDISPKNLNADFLSVSGHKIGAPKGIGALYIRDGVKIPPLLYGGGQEKSMRPGTEALPNIAAFAKACEIRQKSFADDQNHIQELRAYLETKIQDQFAFATVNGKSGIPHVINVSFEGCKSEVMLRVLESNDVYVSSGSACAKGKASHVLSAMGVPHKKIDSALRISFAPFNTKEDIDALIDAIQKGASMLKR